MSVSIGLCLLCGYLKGGGREGGREGGYERGRKEGKKGEGERERESQIVMTFFLHQRLTTWLGMSIN